MMQLAIATGGVKFVEIGRFENRSISRHDSCWGSVRLGSAPEEQWRKKICWRKLSEENGCSATNFKSANLNEIQIAAESDQSAALRPEVLFVLD